MTNRSGTEDKDRSFDGGKFSQSTEENTRRYSIPGNNLQNHPILRQNISQEESSNQGEQLQSEEEVAVNKKRQELSDQLKQISVKIDKEILELRKQNNGPGGSMNTSMTMNSKRDDSGIHSLNPSSQNRGRRTDSLNMSQNVGQQYRETPKSSMGNSSMIVTSPNNQGYTNSQQQNTPKVHVGPFNTRCLFM